MNSELVETIAAISTPIGDGGIAVIRISGPLSRQILADIFINNDHSPVEFTSHYLYHGWIKDIKNNRVLDEVMAVFMMSPRSFTGEDIVEISCHGGKYVTEEILQLVLSSGAILASKGEFSKRAFLNGKMDLVQIESVIDIIKSRSLPTLLVSSGNLNKRLSNKIHALRSCLISVLAEIEANIDFEDDMGGFDTNKFISTIENVSRETSLLLSDSNSGIILNSGIKVAIIGRPNVGKSSLLNSLLRYERAIVSDYPGTTRDFIEEEANIAGFPISIVDTAGIREPNSDPERLGVESSFKIIDSADIVLLVLDASETLTEIDKKLIDDTSSKRRIIVLNKTDMVSQLVDSLSLGGPIVKTVASIGSGIGLLENEIAIMIGSNNINPSDIVYITRSRHKEALISALKYLDNTRKTIAMGLSIDLLSIDLKAAIISLGDICGENVSEEVLNSIFDEFCVGK